MNSICENVSAGPGTVEPSQSAVSRFSKGGPGPAKGWRHRWATLIRTDVRLCAKQFLVSPDITAVITVK